MITKEDFAKLGAGHIIIWRDSYLRTVIEGPADDLRDPAPLFITLPIRRRSWTCRAHTTVDYNAVCNKITYTGMIKNRIFSPDELDRILTSGLKPKWDALWMMNWYKRTGHKCSNRVTKLMKEAVKSFRFAGIK